MSIPPKSGRPSTRTFLATGLFARLAHAIDRGCFVEANQARARLVALGFVVTFTKRSARRRKGGAL